MSYYYDTRLGIGNNFGASGTPEFGSATDFALNSIFANALNSIQQLGGGAPQFDNSALQASLSNPFSFGSGGVSGFPSFDFSNMSSGFPSFDFGNWGIGGSNNTGPVQFPSFIDQKNIEKIKTLDPDMQKAVVELIKRGHERGINGIEVDSVLRTKKRQQEIYDEEVREGKPNAAAKPGHSRHEFGRAVDLNIVHNLKPEEYAELGRIWRDEMGFTYGMDFSKYRERWHFDLRPDIRKFGRDNPTNRGWETTWLGKGGQSAVASNGGSSNLWGGLNFSMPSFGGGMNFSMPTFSGGFGFGGGFDGNWLNAMFSGLSFNGGFGNANAGTTFERGLNFVLNREGGLANNVNDKGGLTNKGITHATYDSWRRSHGLPTQSVTNITNDEVRQIYYERYWVSSGADKISDSRMAIEVFDSAVNMGVSTAKTLYQQSGGDLGRFIQLRKQRYEAIAEKDPTQKVHLNRWLQRSDAAALI